MSAPAMARHRTVGLALIVGLVGGCTWGTTPARFEPAKSASGARVAVRVTGEQRDRVGELYAVDSTGVTIRAERLVRIHWPRVAGMDVARLGREFDVRPGASVAEPQRERLALVSRFPQGLDGALLARVLQQLGQDALEEVR